VVGLILRLKCYSYIQYHQSETQTCISGRSQCTPALTDRVHTEHRACMRQKLHAGE